MNSNINIKRAIAEASRAAAMSALALSWETSVSAPIVRAASRPLAVLQPPVFAALAAVVGYMPLAGAAYVAHTRPRYSPQAAAFFGAVLYQRLDNLAPVFGLPPTVVQVSPP